MHKGTSKKNSHHKNYDLYDDLSKIKAAIAEATSDAKGRANELLYQSIENVKDKSEDVQNNISEYVAEKPLKSIGFALLAGFIVGYLIKR